VIELPEYQITYQGSVVLEKNPLIEGDDSDILAKYTET
jgi:hypothetical protein